MNKIFGNLQYSFAFSNESLFFHPFCVLNFITYESTNEEFYKAFRENKKKTEALILQNCFVAKIDRKKIFKKNVYTFTYEFIN